MSPTDLDRARQAWCRANARAPAGPRWEVHGHWIEGQVPRTDVYYLLRPAAER